MAIESLESADLRGLLDSIPNFILTLDADRRILHINHVVPGLTREHVIGLDALLFVPPEAQEKVRAHWDAVLSSGEPVRYETAGTGPDGSTSWYSSVAGPLRRDGQVVGIVLSTIDITDRKRLEETARQAVARAEVAAAELAEKNRRLGEELAERAAAEEQLRAQREALRALSTPILAVWDGILALPVIGALDAARAAQMMERLLEEIVQSQARFAILDLTGVGAVDTATAGYLLGLVRAAGLLGSRCLVSGVSPSVAQSLVHLEVGLEKLQTFGTLRDALRYAIRAEAGGR